MTNSTSVEKARATLEQEIYDEMSGGVPGRDVRWPDALDTLIAAVRAEERARARQVANDVLGKQSERMAEQP